MAGRPEFDLDADEIVDAALAILNERGLEAVSMRNVGARLGVSPVPLYRRVGNKEALLDAMAARLFDGLAPSPVPDEAWPDYTTRWAYAVRSRFAETTAIGPLLGDRRAPFVEASRPLITVLRAQGFAADEAVQACRIVLWAVAGFSLVQGGTRGTSRNGRRRPGGDASGVTRAEADHLFGLHIRYVIEGIERNR